MSRWEPDARGRLEQAALQLFSERGYDETTVAEIAEQAGLTERTFFRHFTDKREVLFGGGAVLAKIYRKTITAAPDSLTPLEMVSEALLAVGKVMEERRKIARQRQTIITANPELQERELLKLASLSSVIAETLRARGVAEPAASLSGGAGTTVFRIAFEQWICTDDSRPLTQHIEEVLDQFSAIVKTQL